MGNAIIGMDPMDIEKVYWAMNKSLMRNPAAKAAIDIAVHDLIGKITNQPLYKLLGGYILYTSHWSQRRVPLAVLPVPWRFPLQLSGQP